MTSAASLSGSAQAGFRAGGISGALKASIGQPAADMASRASAPLRDAWREGSAYGAGAVSGAAKPGASSPSRGRGSAAEPDWARRIRRREQMSRAGTLATHTIDEGDRGAASEGPDLDPDK